jgi:hypothetical protein
MGPIYQRDQEHLGTSDLMIIRTRARLLAVAKALRDRGEPPPGAGDPEMFRVRSLSVFLPRDVNWITATADWLAAKGSLPKERLDVALRQ